MPSSSASLDSGENLWFGNTRRGGGRGEHRGRGGGGGEQGVE